jgi:hypothetical protein
MDARSGLGTCESGCGSWKNGISSFVPAWVTADQQRFPRVQNPDGPTVQRVRLYRYR